MKRPGPGRATEGGLGPLRWSTSRSRRRLSSRCKSGETVQSLTGYPENSNPHTTGEDGAHKGWSAQRSSTGCCWRTATSPATGRGQRRKISTRGGARKQQVEGKNREEEKRRRAGIDLRSLCRGRSGARVARSSGEPERPDERRRAEALGERDGSDATTSGEVDRRLRVEDVRRCRGAGVLVAARGAATGHVGSARRLGALHRDGAGRQAPAVRLVRHAHLSRLTTDRDRAQRRHDLRYSAQSVSRALVASSLHVAREGQRPALHAEHDLRDVPVPGWSDAGVCPRPTTRRTRARLRSRRPRADSSSCATAGSTRPNGSSGWTRRLPDIRDVLFLATRRPRRRSRKRTLTNLYNARPQWLADAHAVLDASVAGAYGWSDDITDDDALRELLVLNGGS